MNDLFVYRFQTKVRVHSVNEKLANFLKEKDADLTEKERVWWAVSAFWLPIAMFESNSYTEKEIQQYGLSAIQRLQQQIAHLALTLDLEVPQIAVSTLPLTTNCAETEGEAMPSPNFSGTDQVELQKITEVLDNGDDSDDANESILVAFPTDIRDYDDVFGYQ